MTKLDYKKLWEQQKKDNVLMRTENEKLYKKVDDLKFKVAHYKEMLDKEIEDTKSWEYLRNIKAGEGEGIMRCFKELLNNKNQQK